MIWDRDNLNAPHTLRELAQDGEPATGSTTEPENATCPSAGHSAASGWHDKSCHLRRALDAVEAERASWPHAGSMHDGARHACAEIARLKDAMQRLRRMEADAQEQRQFEEDEATRAEAEVRRLSRVIAALAGVWDGTRHPNSGMAAIAFAELSKSEGRQ